MTKLLQNFLFVCLLLSGVIAHAQTSPTISIQGTLKDASGASVDDGMYSVDFKLYHQLSGGPVLWVETASVEVTGGIYSHYLGSITPLNANIFGQTLFLGVKVGSFELTPRTEMTYAPYTFASNTVSCSGALGDVKYSILNPTQFAAANGDCWVPMTGGSMSGSALALVLGTSSIPDAGGLFIRAQETVGGANHDPDRSPTSPIAQFENQTMQNHTHTYSGTSAPGGSHNHYIDFRLSNGTATGDIGNLDGHYPPGAGGGNTNKIMFAASDRTGDGTLHQFTVGDTGNHSHSFSGTTANHNGSGSEETRPKNMNLYIYIRIN